MPYGLSKNRNSPDREAATRQETNNKEGGNMVIRVEGMAQKGDIKGAVEITIQVEEAKGAMAARARNKTKTMQGTTRKMSRRLVLPIMGVVS